MSDSDTTKKFISAPAADIDPGPESGRSASLVYKVRNRPVVDIGSVPHS